MQPNLKMNPFLFQRIPTNLSILSALFHRFFKRFELPLLAQSLVMNITMFLMIHLCVKVKRNNSILKARERIFTGNFSNATQTFIPFYRHQLISVKTAKNLFTRWYKSQKNLDSMEQNGSALLSFLLPSTRVIKPYISHRICTDFESSI